jgi:hypothetical protein
MAILGTGEESRHQNKVPSLVAFTSLMKCKEIKVPRSNKDLKGKKIKNRKH